MTISTRIQNLQPMIAQQATLLAVSKQQPIEAIREAYRAGIRHFGENYLQEALPKIQALADLPIHWHFIGRIQRNKIAAIAQHFSWVHTLTDQDMAERLNEKRGQHLPKLNVCIQLNLDKEASKGGITPEELEPLVAYVSTLPHLTLRGLMAIPKATQDPARQHDSFLRFAQWQNHLNQTQNLSLDTLSMGMSDDFISAIQAGSTLVRLGTAIFGQRYP